MKIPAGSGFESVEGVAAAFGVAVSGVDSAGAGDSDAGVLGFLDGGVFFCDAGVLGVPAFRVLIFCDADLSTVD